MLLQRHIIELEERNADLVRMRACACVRACVRACVSEGAKGRVCIGAFEFRRRAMFTVKTNSQHDTINSIDSNNNNISIK